MLEPEGATADEVKTDEEVVPKSMDDTIRDTLREMKSRDDTATAEPDTAVPRDERGKFSGRAELSEILGE